MTDTNKKPRVKRSFTEAFGIRMSKITKIATNLKRASLRAGIAGTDFDTIDASLKALAARAAALPADFKPKRVVLPSEPLAQGASVQLSPAAAERLHDLMDASVIAGNWTVLKSTAEKVQAKSDVDTSITSFFSRRDVHLAGQKPRVSKPRKAKAAPQQSAEL